ncbi:MAG: hypothetical protein E7612_02580 [Ruminococcaceae bacterium]|nr:hypothetical protein [Oscillospiraceae bacterium]
MAKETEEYKSEIEESKFSLEEKYALAMTAARKIAQRNDELSAAEEVRDLRGGSKDIAKHEIAESLFASAVKKFFYFLSAYDQAVENCITLYSQFVSSACARDAKKARAEAEKLESRERYRRDKLFDVIRYVHGIDDMYSEYVSERANRDDASNESFNSDGGNDSRASAQSKEPDAQNLTYSEREYQPSSAIDGAVTPQKEPQISENYNVSAASIDISPIIEEAVSAAMAKFNSALDKCVDEAIRDYAQKIRAAALPADSLKMHSELVDFELEMAGKLSELTDKLKGISDTLTEITAACMALSDARKNIEEDQKKENDT